VLLVESGLGDTVAKNRKMVHLQAGLDEAHRLGKLSPDTVVVHADADVVLAPGDVDQLVRTLRERGPHGAAFAAPWPTGGTPLSEHLAQLVLSGSLQSFAVLHALARITGGAPALSGKFVAWSAPTLQRMGGYRAFDHFIGDDVAMVDALHGQGFPVSLSPRAVVTEAPHRSVQVLQDQLKRWLQVASAHRPGLLVAYPTLVAPLPLTAFLALAAMVGGNHDDVQVALGATLAVLLCRLLLLGTLVAGPYRRAEVKRSPVGWRRWGRLPFALVAADALVLRAALAAAGRRDVLWQGRVYQLAQGGRIANCVRPGSYSTSNVSKLQA
jgi:hypothetical protein